MIGKNFLNSLEIILKQIVNITTLSNRFTDKIRIQKTYRDIKFWYTIHTAVECRKRRRKKLHITKNTLTHKKNGFMKIKIKWKPFIGLLPHFYSPPSFKNHPPL